MKNDFMSKLDAFLFRVLGLALGVAGCVALLMNNPPALVFSNPYGIIFLLMFGALGLYSAWVTIQDFLPKK